MRATVFFVAAILVAPSLVNAWCVDYLRDGTNGDCLLPFTIFTGVFFGPLTALGALAVLLGQKGGPAARAGEAEARTSPASYNYNSGSNSHYRGKRSAHDENAETLKNLEFTFSQLDQTDCYKRLVCEVAAGADYKDKASKALLEMINIANREINMSPKIKMVLEKLSTSARVGKISTQSIQNCKKVYSRCPVSGAEMNKLVAKGLA